jgi:hypothetical protein
LKKDDFNSKVDDEEWRCSQGAPPGIARFDENV